MIDYSTQYPWNFGTLSVIMATGTYTTHFSHHIYTSVLRFDVYIILCVFVCVFVRATPSEELPG